MSEGVNLEIERKYLIEYPDVDWLKAQPGCVTWRIMQTYLRPGEGGQTRRLREVTVNGEVHYYRTFKRMIDAMSNEEDEAEISRREYEALLRERDLSRRVIAKTRYRIPWRDHVLEFDIYPFWQDRAILEIELTDEEDDPGLPDYARVIRDVTGKLAYKNSMLAREIPAE